jgi:hypothetical protein
MRLVKASLSVSLVLLASSAAAQEAPALRDNRVTINAGMTWSGAYDIGGSAAELRGNATGAAAPPFPLMTSESRVTPAAAPEVRVGVSLTPRLTVEGGASRSRPRVGVRIFGDAEAPSEELPGEQLEQYVFDGGLSWQVPLNLGRRMAPFVAGGAGYLRQLHEDRTFAETGRIYYAGGGARYWLRGGHGNAMPAGLRGEFRINLRRDGIDFEDQMRVYPTFSLFLFIGL